MANVDITVQHAEGDSDYKICTVACRAAQAGVIANDTDIFQSSLAIMLKVVSDIVSDIAGWSRACNMYLINKKLVWW